MVEHISDCDLTNDAQYLSPLRMDYGVSIAVILKKIDGVIIGIALYLYTPIRVAFRYKDRFLGIGFTS